MEELIRDLIDLERRLSRLETLDDAGGALYSAVNAWKLFPGLRAFWLYSSVDNANVVYDESEQGRTIAPGTAPTFAADGLIPYAGFTGASSQYLTRADEAGLDITGGLSLVTWVNFGAGSTGATTGLMSKWVTTGNQRSYLLQKTSANVYGVNLSSNGTATTATASTVAYVVSTWHMLAAVYTPSTSLDILVDGTWTRNTTSIPASIFNSTSALDIGRFNATNYLTGNLAFTAICASALSDAIVENAWNISRVAFGV